MSLRHVVMLLCVALGGLLYATASSSGRTAVVLQWNGAIGPATADYLVRRLRDAAQGGAAVVVLTQDTQGRLDTSMRERSSGTS